VEQDAPRTGGGTDAAPKPFAIAIGWRTSREAGLETTGSRRSRSESQVVGSPKRAELARRLATNDSSTLRPVLGEWMMALSIPRYIMT